MDIFDFSLSDKNPIITDEMQMFLQEIDFLLSTEKGSKLCDYNFGSSIDELLWQTNLNANYIENEIEQQIKNNCLMHEFFSWSVSLQFMKGENRDIGILDIIIKREDESDFVARITFD